jgi:hypothetical protein
MSNQDYTADIMRKLETKKMRPRSYFIWLDALRVFLIVIFSILIVLALSIFGHDLWRGNQLLSQVPELWPVFLRSSFIELVLFSLLIFGLIVVIYRQTDWPFVRQIGWLLIGGGILAIVLSGLIVYEAERDGNVEDVVANMESALESLPYRIGDRQGVIDGLETKQYFAGRVSGFLLENGNLTQIQIRDLQTVQTFEWQAGDYTPRLNQPIMVRYEVRDNKKVILEYKTSKQTSTPSQKQAAPIVNRFSIPSLQLV